LKLTLPDVPPPGAGVLTATGKVPPLASRLAGMVAVSWVELTNVVAKAVPLKTSVVCWAKPEPLAVSAVLPLPTMPELGLRDASTGEGFEMLTEAEFCPAGVATLVAVIVTVFGEGGTGGAV
jgi:hypothetical protein